MIRPASEKNGPSSKIHGDALLIGENGVLLRGASGIGKSALTLTLVEFANARGVFARLIGDDRLELSARHGRLIARPHPTIAGLIEARGLGILSVPHEPAGVIRLVVDLIGAGSPLAPRLPPEESRAIKICGILLPRLWTDASHPSAAGRIFYFFHRLAAK
jgi:HPr kinase/phosphorylase